MKSKIYNAIILLLLAAGATYVVLQFTHFGKIEYTDNARVKQYIAPQITRAQGFIREIRFEDFQEVKKGDTLVIIEDSEYRLRLAQARQELTRAEQMAKATGSSIQTTTSSLSVTDASIDEARVNMENLAREDARYEKLLSQNAVTQQQFDQIHTAYLSAKARYTQIQNTHVMQTHVITEQGHHLTASEAAYEQAQAAVQLAELNLSYCYILASQDGVVNERNIHLGQLVNPGQTLVSIVDAHDIWIEANFRETQLSHIHVGDEVIIRVDAVPNKQYKGRVERLSDATGSAFSMIPIDNATGNFVKVEQRLTIRISLAENSEKDINLLKAGYSAECEVKYE